MPTIHYLPRRAFHQLGVESPFRNEAPDGGFDEELQRNFFFACGGDDSMSYNNGAVQSSGATSTTEDADIISSDAVARQQLPSEGDQCSLPRPNEAMREVVGANTETESADCNTSKPSAGRKSPEWSCSRCTLLNSNRRKKCQVCGAPRRSITDGACDAVAEDNTADAFPSSRGARPRASPTLDEVSAAANKPREEQSTDNAAMDVDSDGDFIDIGALDPDCTMLQLETERNDATPADTPTDIHMEEGDDVQMTLSCNDNVDVGGNSGDDIAQQQSPKEICRDAVVHVTATAGDGEAAVASSSKPNSPVPERRFITPDLNQKGTPPNGDPHDPALETGDGPHPPESPCIHQSYIDNARGMGFSDQFLANKTEEEAQCLMSTATSIRDKTMEDSGFAASHNLAYVVEQALDLGFAPRFLANKTEEDVRMLVYNATAVGLPSNAENAPTGSGDDTAPPITQHHSPPRNIAVSRRGRGRKRVASNAAVSSTEQVESNNHGYGEGDETNYYNSSAEKEIAGGEHSVDDMGEEDSDLEKDGNEHRTEDEGDRENDNAHPSDEESMVTAADRPSLPPPHNLASSSLRAACEPCRKARVACVASSHNNICRRCFERNEKVARTGRGNALQCVWIESEQGVRTDLGYGRYNGLVAPKQPPTSCSGPQNLPPPRFKVMTCSSEGCANYAVKGGVCWTHGANQRAAEAKTKHALAPQRRAAGDTNEKRRLERLEEKQNLIDSGHLPPCKCKKSKCLKLYCDCFSAQQYCLGCKCNDCHNSPDFEVMRSQVIEDTKAKNPNAFQEKVANGCKCKKSACLKMYCECYQKSIVCEEKCKCVDCKNYTGSQDLIEIDEQRKNDSSEEDSILDDTDLVDDDNSHLLK